MARYIDADALKRRAITVRFFGKDIMMVPTAEIDDAPTIDVVQVVRCKDCRHAEHRKQMPHQVYCHRDSLSTSCAVHDDDDFCKYGERRTE